MKNKQNEKFKPIHSPQGNSGTDFVNKTKPEDTSKEEAIKQIKGVVEAYVKGINHETAKKEEFCLSNKIIQREVYNKYFILEDVKKAVKLLKDYYCYCNKRKENCLFCQKMNKIFGKDLI